MRCSSIDLSHLRNMMSMTIMIQFCILILVTTTTTHTLTTAFHTVIPYTTVDFSLKNRQNIIMIKTLSRNQQRKQQNNFFMESSSRKFRLHAENNNNNNNNNKLEGSVKTKLLSESIAPWRGLRLFLYAAAGSGATIGGLITLSGTAALLSGVRDGDINTELINLAIDFGAAGIFVFLFVWDYKKQNELSTQVEEKLELKKENQKRIKVMKERELEIGNLKCTVRVGSIDQTQEASIRELQVGAKQHIIIVAGPKKACRDALIGANLLKMDFTMSNVLVVPYDTDETPPTTTIIKTNLDTKPIGFGSSGGNVDNNNLPIYETQPYVTKPIGDGWYEYIQSELQDAIEQNGDNVKREGIVIVIANNGTVLRRGVGKVPWRQMVEELQQTIAM